MHARRSPERNPRKDRAARGCRFELKPLPPENLKEHRLSDIGVEVAHVERSGSDRSVHFSDVVVCKPQTMRKRAQFVRTIENFA